MTDQIPFIGDKIVFDTENYPLFDYKLPGVKYEYEYDGMTVNEIDFVDYLKQRGEDGWDLAFASGDFVNEKQARIIWKRIK